MDIINGDTSSYMVANDNRINKCAAGTNGCEVLNVRSWTWSKSGYYSEAVTASRRINKAIHVVKCTGKGIGKC